MQIGKEIFGNFRGIIILDINLKNSEENGDKIDGKGIIISKNHDDMTIDNYRLIRPKNQDQE